METIRLEHEDDPTLWVELSKPTHDAFADCWNDMCAAEVANRSAAEAHRNLLIDCRTSPSEAELLKVLREWPGLPAAAWPELLNLAGGVSWVGLKNARKLTDDQLAEAEEALDTRVIDLYAMHADASQAIAGVNNGPFGQKWGADVDALAKEGILHDHVADMVSSFRRPGSLFAIRTRHGVFILRRPSDSAYMAYMTGSRRDIFRASERLVSACALHPKPGALGPILENLPALGPVFAAELKTMSGEGAAVVKKGLPSSAKPLVMSSSEPSA